MKEIKLIVDGKEFALTKEQIKAFGIDADKGCMCDRVEDKEYYYFISHGGTVRKTMELNTHFDCETYKYGNYYRNEDYAKQLALHQQLNNLLQRYSEQHGGDAEWDSYTPHYIICYSHRYHTFTIENFFMSKFINCVYFSTEEVAKAAIEEVVKPFIKEHPDFMW